MTWSSWPSHFTRNPYLQFRRFVFCHLNPEAPLIDWLLLCRVAAKASPAEIPVATTKKRFFFEQHRKSGNIYTVYVYIPCTVSDSWDCLNSLIEPEGSFIQNFKSFVVFCSSPGLEIWILVPRQRNHYQAQHVLERCNFLLWKNLQKKW